jgi:hypothetical protein
LLILVGSALLLEKIHVLHFGFARVFWAGAMIYGAVQAAHGFSLNAKSKIFWGTLLFLYSVYFFLRTLESVEFRSHFFIPVTMVIVGGGLFMLSLNNIPARLRSPALTTKSGGVWREWSTLFLALGLMGLGGAVILGKLEYIDFSDIWHTIRHYWPVVLILAGLSLILKRKGTPHGAS